MAKYLNNFTNYIYGRKDIGTCHIIILIEVTLILWVTANPVQFLMVCNNSICDVEKRTGFLVVENPNLVFYPDEPQDHDKLFYIIRNMCIAFICLKILEVLYDAFNPLPWRSHERLVGFLIRIAARKTLN
ncbi:hypothetical protein RF11_10571 [Thelohanellus kitauei]|uniref:Uncharacterized protein n=1 Tax=Thelohanellus kitauei TaxID=669202 RepID=A0A0C2N488_THEKT|nr:hypothetical protein RF11_10571 [Thelohanellus kitauei]